MAYRNGTYIAFHAKGTTDPTASDIRYFRLLKTWNLRPSSGLNFVDSHEKVGAVRDSSKRETLRRSLVERLRNSKNMILITSADTLLDRDWVPYEIEYAIDTCKIPLIVAYVTTDHRVTSPQSFSGLWPKTLADRIINKTAHAIHVPFLEKPIAAAVSRFDHATFPKGNGLGRYDDDAYNSWGIP